MVLNIAVVAVGILLSFFLKGINFLSLNFEFMGGGILYPDFLLIYVIFFALRRGEFSGLWIGFIAGLLEDSGLLSFSDKTGEFLPVIGTHALIYCLTGFILGKINRLMDKDRVPTIVLLVFGTTLAERILVWLLVGVLEDFNKSYSFLGPAVYTALLSPIWFFVLGWVYKMQE
ncbi:MAG: rod shape-determining protein MreD [Spirochaetia bacterium]|nr:rod shape-determining protein MreD [Spirochaetia bacterium]